MSNDYKVVTEFGETEVRKQSGSKLPLFFREWESVKLETKCRSHARENWKYLNRRVNVVAYPPFNIFTDWLMDFATISAYYLGRPDWQNFRWLVLLHIPECNSGCWYCFNDAWEGAEGVKTGYIEPGKIVSEFASYRERFSQSSLDDGQRNVLRLSGGEPFFYPKLVWQIADEFEKQLGGEDAFLWVDTNLFNLGYRNGKPTGEFAKSIDSLLRLGPRTAIHACLHGADDNSLRRNTGENFKFAKVIGGLKSLVENGLNVYPRINPLGLSGAEIARLFDALKGIEPSLPAKTYLGPIELYYEASTKRIREFITKDTPKKVAGKRTGSADYKPANTAVYVWNKLMVQSFGVGYGVVPRHLTEKIKSLKSWRGADKPQSPDWKELILISKGWEREIYARKLLELLALPEGAVIHIEYENRWVEPTFLSHVKGTPDFWVGKDVLMVATFLRGGKAAGLAPLRYGSVKSAYTDEVKDDYSIQLEVVLGGYLKPDAFSAAALLGKFASYIGMENLPGEGFYCQYVGLPDCLWDKLKPEEQEGKSADIGFKRVVLNTVRGGYAKATSDVYYRIKKIHRVNEAESLLNDEGTLVVNDGDEIIISLESCNPNLGNEKYPDYEDTEIEIISTASGIVNVTPQNVYLSKYGESEVRVRFKRAGEEKGVFVLRQVRKKPRTAELRIPFKVEVK